MSKNTRFIVSLLLSLVFILPMGLSQSALANAENETDAQLAYDHSAAGYAYNEEKKYREALAEYVRAMELDQSQETYQEWVISLLSQIEEGELDESEPSLAYAHSALGYLYSGQEKYWEALTEYVRAMELFPVWENHQNWVASLLLRVEKGELDESKAPFLAYAHSALGHVYNGQEKYPEALAEYIRAVELDPSQETYRSWVDSLQAKINEQ